MYYPNILVTGGRGFILFNGLKLWKTMYPKCNFYCLDANTYADKYFQDEKNKFLDDNNIPRFELDLGKTDAFEKLCEIIEKYHIDAIIHGAAESHVDNSIKNPNIFFESNVLGTINILNVTKKYNLRLHIVSTDEVYGETTPKDWKKNIFQNILPKDKLIVPSSPYSSSKASADIIALSYYRTFGTRVTISRCSNNAGKYQHNEKMIGTIISHALKNEKIPVYGNGLQKRHWIDVDDHNIAIMNILENGIPGEIYNIGPVHENYITNLDLVKFILKYLKKSENLIEFVKDRLGHDISYYIPISKSLKFKTKSYKEFMPKIIDWYIENL